MKKQLLLSVCIVASGLLSGCMATGGGGSSVGDYAMGDDSATIKKGRNRASAQVSRAELAQHRRQRANVSEELDLEDKKRRNKKRQVDGSLGTTNRFVNTIRNIRWGW